jgi:uncharacterized membrane protein
VFANFLIFLLGMVPIGEARIAIPIGISMGMPPMAVFFYAVLGNLLSVIALVFLLEPIMLFLRRKSKTIDKFLEKLFHKIRKKHSKNFERFQDFFLFLLVMIPLPGSGGYTGALLVWLFDIPKKTAIILISAGVIIAGLLVLGATLGIVNLPFLNKL